AAGVGLGPGGRGAAGQGDRDRAGGGRSRRGKVRGRGDVQQAARQYGDRELRDRAGVNVPSPLVGEGQGEGFGARPRADKSLLRLAGARPPSPALPLKGGGRIGSGGERRGGGGGGEGGVGGGGGGAFLRPRR